MKKSRKSGSGKSTIIKLISRQISSKNGGIFFEGIDYYNFTSNEIRKKLALISQESTLFPMSIEDNIRIGNPVLNYFYEENEASCAFFAALTITSITGAVSSFQPNAIFSAIVPSNK